MFQFEPTILVQDALRIIDEKVPQATEGESECRNLGNSERYFKSFNLFAHVDIILISTNIYISSKLLHWFN